MASDIFQLPQCWHRYDTQAFLNCMVLIYPSMIKVVGGVKENKRKVRKEAATYEEIMYAAALPYV